MLDLNCDRPKRKLDNGRSTIGFLTTVVLERRDEGHGMKRFYVLPIEPALFGDTALVREWGRLGTLGRRRIDHHATGILSQEALGVWLSRKLTRLCCHLIPEADARFRAMV